MHASRSVILVSITLLPALISYFLVARAILDGNESDIRYALGLFGVFLTSVVVTRFWMPTPPSLTKMQVVLRILILIVPTVLIYPMTVVVLIFGKVDMAAFVFHLVFGMDGTPWADFAPYLVTAGVFWLVFCVSLWRARFWIDQLRVGWVGIAIAVLAINPLVYDLAGARISGQFSSKGSYVDLIRTPETVVPAQPYNLIVLYLEGFDRGYLSHPDLAGLAPELQALSEANPSPTSVHQVFGTGWSLSGNIATQCGLPVLPMGARPLSSFSEVKEIMPHMTCLGDVLAGLGYDQTYVSTTKILGNKMGYYGFDNFYSSHGFDRIIDRDQIVAKRPSLAKRSEDDEGWGIFDGEMLAFMLDFIDEKDAQPQPYAVVMATMDTHGPRAVISPECTQDGQGGSSLDMRDAISCTSQMVETFLAELEKRIDMSRTRIVILSDHLAHHNNLTHLLDEGERYNFVTFVGGPDEMRLGAPSSMFDIYPTLLDWMGILAPKQPFAGLGVSLLSDQPTLVEQHPKEEIDARLRVDVELARFIWQ